MSIVKLNVIVRNEMADGSHDCHVTLLGCIVKISFVMNYWKSATHCFCSEVEKGLSRSIVTKII